MFGSRNKRLDKPTPVTDRASLQRLKCQKLRLLRPTMFGCYDGECPKTDLKMGDYQLNTLQKNSVSVPDDWTASMEEI